MATAVASVGDRASGRVSQRFRQSVPPGPRHRSARPRSPIRQLIEAFPMVALGAAVGLGLAAGVLVGKRVATRVTLRAVKAGARQGLVALGTALASNAFRELARQGRRQ